MHRFYLFFLAALVWLPLAVQGQDNVPQHLEQILTDWMKREPMEKVYVHTDKPYYAAGDTIWLKAYLCAGAKNQLSAISGTVYIDLLQGKEIRMSLRLPVVSGTAKGDIPLPLDQRAGVYTLRAYTQWMRNFDAAYFYHRTLTVGQPFTQSSTEKNQTAASPSHQQKVADDSAVPKPEVYFFPEGGTWVHGLYTRVAVKAVDAQGKGLATQGIITDAAGNEVAKWEHQHAGMALFWLAPQAHEPYTAHVTFAHGQRADYPLPKVAESGQVLQVDTHAEADTFRVRIQTTADAYGTYYLLAHKDGRLLTLTEVTMKKPLAQLLIASKEFPIGVVQFTLFSAKGEPLNERLVFAHPADTLQLMGSEAVDAEQSLLSYTLQAKNAEGFPEAGTFSVALIDENNYPSLLICTIGKAYLPICC